MPGLAANFQHAFSRLNDESQQALEAVVKIAVRTHPAIAVGGMVILPPPPRLTAGAKSLRAPWRSGRNCGSIFHAMLQCGRAFGWGHLIFHNVRLKNLAIVCPQLLIEAAVGAQALGGSFGHVKRMVR